MPEFLKVSIILLMCFIIYLSFVSAIDEQMFVSCGGDDELIIGCPISDEQLIFLGGERIIIGGEMRPYQGMGGGLLEVKEEEEKITIFSRPFSWKFLLFLLEIFAILLFFFILWKRKKEKEKKEKEKGALSPEK